MTGRRGEIKARILTVRVPVHEVGFLSSLVDGLGRVAIARTRKKGDGVVDIIASPDRFQDLLEAVEGFKKHLPDLEILGESDSEGLKL